MPPIAIHFQTPSGVVRSLLGLGAVALERWQQLPKARRVGIWRAGLAVWLVMLGLLVAFHQVVSSAVDRAAEQRKLLAWQTTETLRCKALPGQNARDYCLSLVQARMQARVGSGGPEPVRALTATERIAAQ